VRSSQTLVKAGDADAVKLYNENNKIPMTDAAINEDEIKTVLAYIKTKGEEMAAAKTETQNVSAAAAPTASSPAVITESNVNLLNMFSFTEYLLMGLLFLFLIIIWMLGKTIKSLSIQLNEKYNGHI
jgi:hypothetical protein